MKREHYDLIIAWANGTEIERYDNGRWYQVTVPMWIDGTEYRIKPEPNPDVVLYSCAFDCGDYSYATLTSAWNLNDVVFSNKKPNIKLTYDCETNKLKSVELI